MLQTMIKPVIYYTVHSHPNKAFTLRVNETARTCMVGFKTWKDAHYLGKMVETYFVQNKSWPDMNMAGALTLPTSRVSDDLSHIYIQKWEFEELKLECARNTLNLVSVEAIQKNMTGYNFAGNVYMFDADLDFYRDRFEELVIPE